MSEQTKIDSPLLRSLLLYADEYLLQLDYWYGMAKNGDGGSVNHASSTVYYDFDGDYDKSLKEFRERITELKTIIKDAREVLGPRSERRSAIAHWEKMFRERAVDDEKAEYIVEVLSNARKELDKQQENDDGDN